MDDGLPKQKHEISRRIFHHKLLSIAMKLKVINLQIIYWIQMRNTKSATLESKSILFRLHIVKRHRGCMLVMQNDHDHENIVEGDDEGHGN